MLTVDLYNTLWFACMAAEVTVVGLLLYRRVWRRLPVFLIYCVWSLFSDVGGFVVLRFFHANDLGTYLAQTILDSALQFGVLVELAWSILRPVRASLPRSTLVVLGVLILAVGASIWPFSGIHQLASLPLAWRVVVRVMQTFSILRVLFFLALAGCSQLFSIGWRDRELQIATGFGFYSIVSIATEVLHSYQTMGPLYKSLNEVVVASNFCSLLYWSFCFSQEEAKRREFTPQMQSFLLAVAGNARAFRAVLTGTVDAQKRGRKSDDVD
jgi:hypothetical protein